MVTFTRFFAFPITASRWLLLIGFLFPGIALPRLEAVEDNGNYANNSDPGSGIPNWTTGWPGSGTDGWNYVGQVNGASGTYLGNGWVITAAHVGANNFTLDGTTYTMVSGSAQLIDAGNVDFVLFQVASPPSLPPLPLAQTPPTPFSGTGTADAVALIGYGGGYGETWGFNTVTGAGISFQLLGRTTTDFATADGTVTSGTQTITNNAELVSGDSGGGDFIYNAASGQWQLAGINEAAGGSSYFVQISAYVQQILDITGLTAPPAIATPPAGATVNAGSSISLSVSANGSSPLSYQWLKNGTAITGATSAAFSISSAALGDSGSYAVEVSNGYGSVTSPAAAVSVVPLTLAPLPATQVVVIGEPASFSVSAQGAGPFSYQWMLNGSAISGATSSSYAITAVSAGSAGSYSVEVSNTYGNATSSACQLVPVVSQQTILAGQSATFTATPTGEGPFTYQWQFNGANISSATGQSYTVGNVGTGQSGVYTVIITGPGGDVSENYSLIVTTFAGGDVPVMPAESLSLLALLLVLATGLAEAPRARAEALPRK